MAAKKEDAPLRLRFRRTITLGGTSHPANTHTAVEANDEAWAAVNRGDADVDPPPGVDGQPFPPEELTTAPSPVPGLVATVPGGPLDKLVDNTKRAADAHAAAAGTDYEAMSAEDLHHEATKRNLDGRSGLDKAGLVKALAADDKKRAKK